MIAATSLQFTGDWNVWLGFLAAGGAAAAAWFLYRRETYDRSDARRWLLPTLRAAAIFLVVLALTGPVLHHEKILRELGRLFVFVDGSQSMDLTDEEMPPSRKVASMQAMGLLSQSDEFKEAQEASAHLAKARRAAERAIQAGPENDDLTDLVGEFADGLSKTFEAFEKFSGDSAGLDSPARGFIAFQRWDGSDAGWVFDRSRRRRGDGPAASNDGFLETFEFPATGDTSFAVWIRGYLHPPKDGDYRFWISSDDRSELYISADEKPSRTERAARVSGWNEFRAYDAGSEQRSREYELKAGRRYYVEAVLEAGTGTNFLSVAWQVPGEDRVGPIPGSFLSPYIDTKSRKKNGPERLDYFRENLLAESVSLRDEARRGKTDPFKTIEKLSDLDSLAGVLSERTRDYVLTAAANYHANNRDSESYQTAVAKFDRMTRKQRIERLLLDEDTGILSKLADQQDIELVSLRDDEVDPLWWQRRGGRKQSGDMPADLEIPESGRLTNISDTIQAALGKEREGVGVIAFTDGRHNKGTSPIAVSKGLGELGVPFFPVGLGADKPPQDMALTGITAPETVFSQDRVKGEITLNDFMKPGIPYKLRIAHDGKTLWEEEIESNSAEKRTIEYDFAVEDLVEQLIAMRAKDDLVLRSMPLFFKATILPAGGNESNGSALERVTENNEKPFYVQAVTQPRKVLLIDGRPRWETRYLKNLFERDERWEVNALMKIYASSERTKGWRRGTDPETFPATLKELNTYSMIVIGDVPVRLFREEELKWIADFTEKRGGGLIFIDGHRQNLKKFVGTPLGKLLPVEWVDPGYKHGRPQESDMPKKLVLTTAGKGLDAMRFVTASLENEEIWDRLHPPHWVAPTLELPGSEVLASAIVDEKRSFPAFVFRRYGAGRVLYCGIDEAWRWRYNVADRYHQTFWVQMTNWISEKPFAVEDKHVSISADKLVYDPGRRADIRVRIRDEKGQPVTKGDFTAVIYDGTDVVSEIELEADKNKGGIFRGRTGELDAGNYEIAIREKYFLAKPKEYLARAEFVVRDMNQQELDNLSLDNELLTEMAQNSGGQFFYEEETRNLVDLLESIDRKKVISSQTVLWSSYWWFVAIIGLLTAEWILRKKSGYV